MDVVIDGVTYTPGGHSNIGVAVTTRNRPDVLAETLEHIREHTPGAPVVVVDDASSKPVEGADYRFSENVGIARAKNKCLELLYDLGVEHLFLFDDDTYPIVDEWYRPYVESPAEHLMYIFQDKAGTPHLVHDDGEVQAWTNPRGCMLYATRRCLEAVGGMDRAWGKWGGEHADWSTRIFNAGLTHWRFADVKDSDKLIHCGDESGRVRSTTPADAKREVIGSVMERLAERERSVEVCSFREPENVVLTCMYKSKPDPQRPNASRSMTTDKLRKSVTGAELVTITDQDDGGVKRPLHLNMYLQRHVHYYEWLKDNPAAEWVFCVDGTDVEMLNEPWSHLERGLLYVGYEPRPLDYAWMFKEHPSKRLQDFFTEHRNDPILNAGVYGGHRETVIEFLHEFIRLLQDNAVDRLHKRDQHDLGNGDMGSYNYVLRTRFSGRIVTGPRVTTVFKAEERNDFSWWKHK